MSSRLSVAIALALLALALALPAAASAAERVVSVSADATVRVPNDSASFGFSVVKERRKRGAALKVTSGKLRAVISAVQKIPGVGPGDVTTGRVEVRKVHRGHRVYWRVKQGIGVTLHEAARSGEVIGVALHAGASGVSGPNYFVSDPAGAFGRALGVAFESAKAKATVLAAQAGAVLGPAISIDEGEGAEFLQPAADKESSAGSCGVVGSPNRHAKTSKAKKHRKRAHARRAHAKRAQPGLARVSSRCTTSPAPTKPGRSTVSAHVHVVFELR